MNFIKSTFTLVGALALVACDDSSSASGGFSCDVTRTSTSVRMDEHVSGFGNYVSNVTVVTDDSVTIATEYWYAEVSVAQSACREWTSEAEYGFISVSCSGNSIYVDQTEKGALDDYERDFEKRCSTDRRTYEENGIKY